MNLFPGEQGKTLLVSPEEFTGIVEERGHLARGQGNGRGKYMGNSLELCWERRG